MRAESIEPRCAYCHSLERLLGMPLEADHITASSRGGQMVLSNLCLACRTCNGHKWHAAKARDPVGKRLVYLFHPRRQKWSKHFQWSTDGTRIIGLTANGRATVAALQMNNDLIVNLRSLWVTLGLHPSE
ncbi:MAG TPA: HNH endonuclease [Blastocatellia bacterium]|nr:HNH endonuclease [Blastocatellia bacterium]